MKECEENQHNKNNNNNNKYNTTKKIRTYIILLKTKSTQVKRDPP